MGLSIDGTSRSGLEAVLASVIEPGDVMLVPVFGRFGHLLIEMDSAMVLRYIQWNVNGERF